MVRAYTLRAPCAIRTAGFHCQIVSAGLQTPVSLDVFISAHYLFPNLGADIHLNWIHLQTKDTDSVSVNPASQWISAFSQTGIPPTKNGDITGIYFLKHANTIFHVHYDAVYLDIGKYINFGQNLQTCLFTGLSRACLQFTLDAYVPRLVRGIQ